MEVVRIPIDELDASYQTRVKTDEATVEKYATDFNEYGGWGDFPPLEVIDVCGVKHIGNGIHRYKAAKIYGIDVCPCIMREGTLLDVHRLSTVGNYRQGLSYTAADRRHSRELAILTFWPTGEYTTKEIGDACECSDETIRREIKRLESEGKLEHVDFVVGADGKKYPTRYSKPASTNVEPETKQQDYTICPQCGAPIWPENKGNLDYTYTERSGQWFCSEECAEQWEQERLSDEAEALTGIPDELPEPPSAKVYTPQEFDEDALPVVEPEEPPEPEGILIECIVPIVVPRVFDPKEALRIVREQLPQAIHAASKFQIPKGHIYLNIKEKNINDLNNIYGPENSEKFTRWQVNVLSGKSVVRMAITQKKFEEWKAEFGKWIDVEQSLDAWSKHWNEKTGSEVLKAGNFWSSARTWLTNDKKRAGNQTRNKSPYRDESGLTSQEGY